MEIALKVIFILTFAALALGDLGRIQFENGIAITTYDTAVGLLVLTWLAHRLMQKKKERISAVFLKPILVFAGVGLISLVFNFRFLTLSDFTVSFLYLVRWVFYAGIYFVVSDFDPRFKKKIPLIMIFVSFFLVVIPGYIQYFLYPNLRNLYYLGWDEHLYRLVSTFLDPNFTAVASTLLLMLILAMRLGKIGWIVAGLTFIALLLTYSRSGYLMFFVSATTLLFLLGKSRYAILLLLVFAFGIFLLPKNLEGEGVKLLRTASIFNRLESTGNAIAIFKDNPLIGVGFNAYRYAQYRYGFIKGENWKIVHSGAGTDNSFLLVLATTGIIGFMSYLYLWWVILKKTYSQRISNAISVAVLASIIGLAVNSFFLNSLFFPFVMAWMWVLIGLRESK